MVQLRNRRVWLTGASSGIGAALARALAAEGCRLILSARRENLLRQIAETCSGAAEIRLLPFDLAEHSALANMAASALSYWDGVDILIHNAGVGQRGLALTTKAEVAKHIMDVNFWGPVLLTQAVLPHMLERGEGHIAVVSSVLGKFHLPGRSAYVAAKHALHGYFDTLRAELDNANIYITLIFPGWIATEIAQHALQADGTPYGRIDGPQQKMSAEECARRIIKALRRRCREIHIGGLETYGHWLKFFCPRLFDRIVRKAVR